MKRFLILLSFICASYLYALDNKFENYFSFSITPQFEVANGVIKEYVFNPACKNTDEKESQLDWNLSTLALFNLQADFDFFRFMYIGLSGTFAVPQRSGFMQDYDWLNSLTSGWKDDDPTEQTNFSEHINMLEKFIDFRINGGGNLYLPFDIKLTPYLSYKYEFIRLTASGGYTEYKQYNYMKQTITGKVISYEQELNTLLLGLKLYVGCIPRATIRLNFDISPKMTFLTATDYHYIRNIAFRDSFKNLLLIESGITAQYCFTKNHSAGFAGRLQYIPLSKGTTSSTGIDKDGKITGGAGNAVNGENGGTERFIWSLALNYSFSL